MQNNGSIVTQTLDSLKRRLSDNENTIHSQAEQGYVYHATCTFNPPATEKEMNAFEEQTGWVLPPDYRAFLRITNGCRLFDDVHTGGELELYSLQQIIEYNKQENPYEGCYDIAYICQDHIVVHSSSYLQNDKNYLYWKGQLESFEEAQSLGSNFELWLDRLVVCQGAKFWWWPIYTAENYYRLL